MGLESNPITVWISGLKAGDSDAAERLWQEYFARLSAFAKRKLSHLPNRSGDEEDVALSAFHSLCHGAAEGRYPRLADRNSLWPLLALIAARKVCDAATRERRQKRGGGAVRCETELSPSASSPFGFDQVLSHLPTPEEAALMGEECERLLAALSEVHRSVVLLKLDGFTNEEIAQKVGVAPRTIERKLGLIRGTWSKVLEATEVE
ncbi:MAG: ECF-type sigma factor [Pirellulaceae bacterium]|nr:ECF-type sigma factor [Pirellulaceae bacterium]